MVLNQQQGCQVRVPLWYHFDRTVNHHFLPYEKYVDLEECQPVGFAMIVSYSSEYTFLVSAVGKVDLLAKTLNSQRTKEEQGDPLWFTVYSFLLLRHSSARVLVVKDLRVTLHPGVFFYIYFL